MRGLGARAAAREAGFMGGCPSADARSLWKRIEALREMPELKEAVGAERVKLERQRAQLDEALEGHREWARALELLASEQGAA